jgi:hypothetical protein
MNTYTLWSIHLLHSGDSVNNSHCHTMNEKTNTLFYAMVKVLLNYNDGNGDFYAARANMLKAGSLKQQVSCWLKLSAVQLSDVM